MGQPNIESTPVVNSGRPVVVDLKSPSIIPTGESQTTEGVADPAKENGAGAEGKPGEGAAAGEKPAEGAAGEGSAGAAAGEKDGEQPGTKPEGEKPAEDEAKVKAEKEAADAKKALESESAMNKKRFLQLQEETSQVTKAQKALKEDRSKFDAYRETNQAKIDAYDNATRLAKEDPVQLLSVLGVTYEQLTAAVLAQKDPNNPKVANLEKEMEAMKKDQDDQKADQEKKDKQARLDAHQSNLQAYRDRLFAIVDKDDQFALLKLQGDAALKVAIDGAGKYYQTHKVLPDDLELLTATEKLLREQAVERLGKDRVKALLEPAPAKEEKPAEGAKTEITELEKDPATKTEEETPATAATTLSNKLNATAGKRTPTPLKPRDVSVEEASALIKWE